MDFSVHEAPLDHSFQKERRSLASKGSLGKRRRPSRYDVRNSVTGLSDSSNFEKEYQDFSENCTKESSEISINYEDSTLSISTAAKDQVKRKREPGKSAVLIQTWERRSQTEKSQKLSSPWVAKAFHNAAVTTPEKEYDLKLPIQEERMLESPFVRNFCASRFHHDVSEDQNLVSGDYSGKESRKWRTEPDFKSRCTTAHVTKKINHEPEWISLSKKLCAKFIESHLEYSNNDVTKNQQDVNHIIPLKSSAEKGVPNTSKKDENDVCKEPQWVLLSKKLCTKFLEEHIENCQENSSPASVQDVQREADVTEKFHKVSTHNRSQQREEPEWISLSRKLRAKFIEGHLDDPDKVSFDNQLNASDLEENFSVPTLAQKYLDYRNQAHASCQSAAVRQDDGSSENLLRKCSAGDQISKSLTEKVKELSRSMPDILMKSPTQSENFGRIRCEKKSLTQNSHLEDDPSAKTRGVFSNNEAVRVNIDYERFSDCKLPSANSLTDESTNVSVSAKNRKHESSPENHNYDNVFSSNERCSAKSLHNSEDGFSTNDNHATNSVHSFCSSPCDESRQLFLQSGNIPPDNNAFHARKNSHAYATEDITVCCPCGDNGCFKQRCCSDDDTFHTIDLNSNSESIDSLEKTKDYEQYVNYRECEFNERSRCRTASYSRRTNISESDSFGKNSNFITGFDKDTSSSMRNIINSQECNKYQEFACSEELNHNHVTSMLCDTFTDSAHDKKEQLKNDDKLWYHHRNENEEHQVHHLKVHDKVKGATNESFLSTTGQFSHHSREGRSNVIERVDKRELAVELGEVVEHSNQEVRNKNQWLTTESKLQEECRNQCEVQNSSILNGNEFRVGTNMLHSDCRKKNDAFVGSTDKHRRTDNGALLNNPGVASGSSEEHSKRSGEIKTSVRSEDFTVSKNSCFLNGAISDDSNHQKLVISFTVKPHEQKSTSDTACVVPFRDETNQPSNDISKIVTNESTDLTIGCHDHLSKTQKGTHHSKSSTSKIFKYGNFERPALKESAIFYRVCEDETSEKREESKHSESFPKRNLPIYPCPDENTTNSDEGDLNSGLLNNSSSQPMTSEDVRVETFEEIKLKSSDKQRDIKTRLKPLGYLSKISNSNHSTNLAERSAPKRTDSTKSHYIDYKDEHLYMNYNQEYGKIRSKGVYHQNKCHASAPDLSKDIKRDDDVKEENLSVPKAESQQEIKIEKSARGVLSLDCIIKMARSPSLTESPGPPDSISVNRVVSSKESFSQTSPIIPAKSLSSEGEFCAFHDQDYLKDSTSTSFCPSDSECSSWIMTRNNSYVINESSSLNESDISDCSLSVKCDYLSSCSNQNTMETRGRSSSESGSYVQMQNLSTVKKSFQNAVEKSEKATLSSEAGDGTNMRKPSCPATPESLRHLFQLPSKPLFPPTLHTSRVFISKDPPPIYASLPQSSSTPFKQNKGEERGRKSDRSSSLKIRDIAQGIILTFRRFQNISSSTKQRQISPSRYVDVSHLAETNRQVPKEWFSGGNNSSLNFLNGTWKKTGGHSIFSTGRPTRSQSESSGCPVNFRGQRNINHRAEKISLSKKACSRSSSDVSTQPERTTSGNTLETNRRPERFKSGDKVSDRRAKKSNKNRSQQNCSKGRTTKLPESRNVTSISRKVQQMADGTLYLVTTVSGDSSVPGFYSDSMNTSEGNSTCGRQTKAAGESNC